MAQRRDRFFEDFFTVLVFTTLPFRFFVVVVVTTLPFVFRFTVVTVLGRLGAVLFTTLVVTVRVATARGAGAERTTREGT